MRVTVFHPEEQSRPLHKFTPGDIVVLTGSDCPRMVVGNRTVSGSVYLPCDQDDTDCEFMPLEEESDNAMFTKVGNIAVDARKGVR